MWSLPMLKELLSIRCDEKEVVSFDAKAINAFIDDICTKQSAAVFSTLVLVPVM